ncbi:carbohydrate-binding protein [Thioclava sp. BHET1]|nr:carbohydrate-binding protein [Thioclava sp. BHET1]
MTASSDRSDPADWAAPAAAFRPAAYWFWPRLPTRAEMVRQLSDFRDHGFGTILIQARLGLPRADYLSPAFLAAYAEAVDLMAELGLTAGLYDDYNWISGQAAGRTVAGADHLRETMLFWSSTDGAEGAITGITATLATSLGPEISSWLYEGGAPVFADWQVECALLHGPGAGPVTEVGARIVLMPDGPLGCRYRLDGPRPAGQHLTVFLSARCSSARGINYLKPEAGARFVERGLLPFAEALGPQMGRTVSFLFFDQPAPGFYRWDQMAGNLGNALAYAPELRARLERAEGPAFGEQLLTLLIDRGPKTAAIRQRFYAGYLAQIHDAFFAPLRRFCTDHGLALTGHEVLPHIGGFALNGGFRSIDPRVAPAVDFFGLDQLRDETAVDVNNLDAQLGPKLGDSIARASGRSGCLAELYFTSLRSERRAAGIWELTPADLRAQMIRCHLMGARQMILHALFLEAGRDQDPTLFANPRFDFPPGMNYEPWWPHMAAISAETARLSAFLAGATPQRTPALFYPRATAFAQGPRHGHAEAFGRWAEAFHALGQDYLILDETALATARPGRNGPIVNGREIAALILADVSDFAAEDTPAQIGRMRQLGAALWQSGDCVALPADRHFDDVPPLEALRDAMAPLALPGPHVVAVPGLRVQLAGQDPSGAWRLALFNEGITETRVVIHLPGGARFEVFDLAQNRCLSSLSGARLELDLSPQALRALRILPMAADGTTRLPAKRQVTSQLRLDQGWRLQLADSEGPIAVTEGWQAQGFAAISGTGIYETRFVLEREAELRLRLPGLACAAEVSVDGQPIGAVAHPPFALDLGLWAAGPHRLTLAVSNTAANAFYAGTPYAGPGWPDPSGLTKPPELDLLSPEAEEDRPS